MSTTKTEIRHYIRCGLLACFASCGLFGCSGAAFRIIGDVEPWRASPVQRRHLRPAREAPKPSDVTDDSIERHPSRWHPKLRAKYV